MRFYIHWEEASEFTLAVSWAEADTRGVSALCAHFAVALGASPGFRNTHAPSSEALQLKRATGKALPKDACVAATVGDGEDLFASYISTASAASASSSAATAAKEGAPKGGAPTDTSAVKAELQQYVDAAEESFGARMYARCKELYTELLRLQVLSDPTQISRALLRLGEVELLAGRPAAALPLLERSLEARPKGSAAARLVARAHEALGHYDAAQEVLQDALDAPFGAPSAKEKKKLEVALGQSLFWGGRRAEGGALLTKLVQADMSDQETLLAYGSAALELGQTEDAMKIFLKLLTTRNDDKKIRKLLARCLSAEEGLSQLRAQLPFDTSSAAALAFLATIAKDHSAIEVSIKLFEEAVRIVPESATYSLNLAHTLEVELRYDAALEVICAFCSHNPKRSVGDLSCETFCEVLSKARAASDADRKTAVKMHEGSSIARLPAAGELIRQPRVDASVGLSLNEATGYPLAATLPVDKLELLALYMTAAKVLFVKGELEALATLLPHVEKARVYKKLHETSIRNENAYYCCAAQLMSTMPLPPPSHLDQMYIAGDSHALAPAWRTLSWNGATRLLTPVLVTGLKAWHLRPESDFYPKANFEAAIAKIPDGADVIFAFGEIDCREGLLLAVQRARYKDVQEGIETVVAIYVSALVELAKRRRFRVILHPVPPVLKETREVVKRFNATLKGRVEKEPSIHWLEFLDELLDVDEKGQETFVEALALDGTHMSPCYLKLLEQALPSK